MYRAILQTFGFLANTASYAVAGVFILFLLAELLAPHASAPPTARDWVGLILIAVICCAPVLVLRHEIGAAAASLLSLAVFSFIVGPAAWPVTAILALPGLLHIVHALLEQSGQHHTMRTAG